VSAPAAAAIGAELDQILRRMRLPYLRKAAPDVLATARAQRWDPAEVLRVLLAEEVVGRDAATRRMRRKTANFPTGKTFGTWRPDQSSIPEATQNALLTLEWIARAENLVAAGPSGTGKSHFVEALAHAAIDKDLRVAWFTLETLTATVGRAKLDGSTARTIARICRCDLVVVDDVGMLPLAKTAPKRSTASSTPPTNAARSRSPATSNSFSKRVRRVDSVPERAKALSCLGLRLQRSPAKKGLCGEEDTA
jgi:DNA replication protein DnaC